MNIQNESLKGIWLRGMDLNEENRKKELALLLASYQSPSLLRTLHLLREEYIANLSSKQMSGHPGEMAHASGGVDCIGAILGFFEEAIVHAENKYKDSEAKA